MTPADLERLIQIIVEEMAREHSIAETRERGGLIGKVLRGSLRPDVESKVFNAAASFWRC